jgi:hypothetical protein
MNPKWLNPGSGGTAETGDTLSFQLDFTNSSPLAIPNDIMMYARFDENCLLLVSAPGAVYTASNEARWEMSDLGPGESFTATLETQAKAVCSDTVHQGVAMDYFGLGVGTDVNYSIVEPFPWVIFYPAFIKKDKQ